MSTIRPIENQAPALAFGTTAALFGLMAWLSKAPTLTVAAADPARYPWWHQAVYAGTAGVLLLLAAVLFVRGRKVPVDPPGAEVSVSGELPWVAGWLVGALFLFMVAILAVGELARSAAYVMRDGKVTTSLIMGLLVLPVALVCCVTRRRMLVDPAQRHVVRERGKPFVFHRTRWAFTDVKAIQIVKVLRRSITVYRVYFLLQNGKRVVWSFGVNLNLARRDAGLLARLGDWPIEGPGG